MTERSTELAEAELRPLLFSIAYRMLGTVGDAEDVVQEAFLRLAWTRQEGTRVENPRAFLTTVTTRLAIDQLRSTRARRETYFGPWLPEPMITAPDPDPAEVAEMADSLSLSFLVLLETLSPVERAVFCCARCSSTDTTRSRRSSRGRSRTAARSSPARASGSTRASRASRPTRRAVRSSSAASSKPSRAVTSKASSRCAADVEFTGDGGGKARGLPRPVYGQSRVGRLLAAFVPEYVAIGGRIELTEINGQPGTLNFDGEGKLISVFVFEIAEDQIQAIRSIINPDKLAHLGFPLSDVAVRKLTEGGGARPAREDPSP
jgi:RNA polymerase sigma factor (sigma-70 family)